MPFSLDTVRSVTTPEGVELSLRLAGPLSRARAWAVDLAIRIGVFIILAQILAVLGKVGMGLMLVAWFLLDWFYPVVCEVMWNGASPGKKICGLQVLTDDGTPVSWGASIIRNFLRMIDFMPFGYLFGVVSTLLSRDFKRLGDLAAGTIVVYQPKPGSRQEIPFASPVPSPIPLRLAEQQAVIDFAQRTARLTPQRQREIAQLAVPLVGDTAEPTQRLLAIANYLLGRR